MPGDTGTQRRIVRVRVEQGLGMAHLSMLLIRRTAYAIAHRSARDEFRAVGAKNSGLCLFDPEACTKQEPTYPLNVGMPESFPSDPHVVDV